MASVKAPIDIIGTGCYLPERWTETYATADVIAYDGAASGQGRPRVPVSDQGAIAGPANVRVGFRVALLA